MIANKTAGGRLEGLLGDWRVGYAAATPGADSARYNPMRPLTVAEEEGFLRAYEGRDRVVEVDGTGRCTFPGFRTSGSYGLFYRDSTRSSDPTILLWREFLTQAAAAAELVRKYKWPRRLLGVEVDNRDDVVVFDRAGAPIVVVEAKEVVGGRNGLEGLLQEMERCSSSRLTAADISSPSQQEKKYLRLLATKPRWFWAVAPGARVAYEVTYARSAARLHRRERLDLSKWRTPRSGPSSVG
jgi:hypothetical protein